MDPEFVAKFDALADEQRARIVARVDELAAAVPTPDVPLTAKEAGAIYTALPPEGKLRVSRVLRRVADRAASG